MNHSDLLFSCPWAVMGAYGSQVGLIVDSFGALRLDMEARENDQQTQTFISCHLADGSG